MSGTSSDRDLGLLMATSFNAFVDGLHSHLASMGHTELRPVDGYLFRVIHEQGRATVSEVAEILGVSKQAASQAVQSLERRGYVVVEADGDDGRRRIVRLTDRAESVRTSAIAFARSVEEELADELGAARVAELRQSLEALIALRADDASPLVQRLAAI
jgi:DNA-binding MarR family transcriptional regulator